MPAEFSADLLNQRLLFGGTLGGFELGEQILDPAVIGP
jgi:hypothetical protein